MENSNNQPPVPPPPAVGAPVPKASETGYYKKTWQKVLDFLIGFFGALILPVLHLAGTGFPNLLSFYLMNIIAYIVLCVVFFKIKRRFIAIGGIISMCLLPILVFGGCLMMLGGWPHQII